MTNDEILNDEGMTKSECRKATLPAKEYLS